MDCQKCGSKSILEISAKCSDMFYSNMNGKEYEGYVPPNIGLGDDSDYVEFSFCLNCGQIQGTFPVEIK
jgi:hypothetical protein